MTSLEDAGRRGGGMIVQGNSIKIPLADNSVHCAISSYPYFGLRSYNLPPTVWGGESNCQHIWDSHKHVPQPHGDNGLVNSGLQGGKSTQGQTRMGEIESAFCQLCDAWLGCFGLEPTIALHVQNAVLVSREVYRVLRKDGVFWLNYSDSYATSKNGRSAKATKAAGKDDRTFRDKPFSVTELSAKNLCGIPQRVVLALQEDGWIWRMEVPWFKPNAMPSSVEDRPGTAHEHIFMLVKSKRNYFDMTAVRKSGKEWNGQAGTFNRTNGKNTHLEVPGQVRPSHRERDGRVAPGRALRTSDFFFDSLDAYIAHLQDIRDSGGMLLDTEGMPAALVVSTESYSAAHYATFPTKLITPMIKASPEKVCPECGEPWRRIIEKPDMSQRPTRNGNSKTETGDIHISNNWAGTPKSAGQKYQQWRNENPNKTTGWQPTCKHSNNTPIPAVILDPFCGSGTVGQVARELGRRFIGIDLSAKYLLENALPRSERKSSQASINQLPLFAPGGIELK